MSKRTQTTKKPRLGRGEHLHDRWGTPEGYDTWADTKQKKQWVEAKRKNPEHVIFTHVGGFFEFFHEDADVIHEVCDAPYMMGEVAHTGIPQTAFLPIQEKLKQAGHEKISII
jgi:DNA mismatch repair ATPase MutS